MNKQDLEKLKKRDNIVCTSTDLYGKYPDIKHYHLTKDKTYSVSGTDHHSTIEIVDDSGGKWHYSQKLFENTKTYLLYVRTKKLKKIIQINAENK